MACPTASVLLLSGAIACLACAAPDRGATTGSVPASAQPATPAASDADPDLVEGEGTITRVDLEGGFFGLVMADGRRFLPGGLPDEFRVDGLRVHVRGRIDRDAITTQQWAPVLAIDEIRRADG